VGLPFSPQFLGCLRVNVAGNLVLACSPVLDMADSFRAYLGALHSVIRKFPVQQTIFHADLVLDPLDQDPEEDALSEGESGPSDGVAARDSTNLPIWMSKTTV
jgi:hypothetical protein